MAYPLPGIVVGGTQFIAPRFRNITGTDPANTGVECSDTCPIAGGGVPAKAWLVVGYHVRLVTDANVANRLVRLIIDDGTLTYATLSAGQAQAATLTCDYSWGAGIGTTLGAAAVANGSSITLPMPEGIVVPPGGKIRTSTANVQATDGYGAPQIVVWEYLAKG